MWHWSRSRNALSSFKILAHKWTGSNFLFMCIAIGTDMLPMFHFLTKKSFHAKKNFLLESLGIFNKFLLTACLLSRENFAM